MFSAKYSGSCLTFDPKGKIMQIDYAKEAVKQGSTSVGLKSKSHVVLIGLKKAPHDLAMHQEKVFEVDTHMGMVISGMTADARILCKFMRNACLNYQYVFGGKHPIERLVGVIGKKSQAKTMGGGKRPFGVGLLIGAIDASGTHLFETCPSGNYYEYYSMAIGDKCQSAKTYLERNYENFADLGADDLVKQGLKALKASAQETELTDKNVSIGVLGQGMDFKILSTEQTREALDSIAEQGDAQMIQQ